MVQEEVENLNRPLSINETEIAGKDLPSPQIQAQMGLQVYKGMYFFSYTNYCRNRKGEKATQLIWSVQYNLEILMLKPDKNNKRKLQAHFPYNYRCKHLK